MITVTLFTIAKTWKQPNFPLTEEWIKKMWHTYRAEFYSVIKKNGIMSFAANQMDLENIILNKVSQKSYDITYMWNIKKKDTHELIYQIETDSQIKKTKLWLPKGKGGEEG